jgi:hypothetical protein
MEMGMYGHLIKPLNIGAMNRDDLDKSSAAGPGRADRMIRMRGRDHLEGMHLNFAWGVHTALGSWHADMDPHAHPFPECLIFVGLDTANVKYLGAEISCCLGPEQETYTFNEPTVVILPPGMPHGPITTKRVYSPRGFGCWSVELSSEPEITWMGEGVSGLTAEQREAAPGGMKFASAEKILKNKPTEATGKYAHLVKPLKSFMLIERGKFNSAGLTPDQSAQHEQKLRAGEKPGPGNADHLVWISGKELEGLNANIFWGFCSRPGIWRRGAGAHVHPAADEVLVYLGLDPDNGDCLGAEIEVDMGKEHERHLIDRPVAIVCPAGMPHMPQVTRWADRPFAFFAVCLSGEHETTVFD